MASARVIAMIAIAFASSRGRACAFAPPCVAKGPGVSRLALRMLGIPARTASKSPADLSRVSRHVFASDSRPVILFDGVCNLCNNGVDFLLKYDRPDDVRGAFRFAALQSDVGKALLVRSGRAPDNISSIVVVFPHCAYIKSEALLQIAKRIGEGTSMEPLFSAIALGLAMTPKPLRDALYDRVAGSRYDLFGRSDACRLDDEQFSARFVSSGSEE